MYLLPEAAIGPLLAATVAALISLLGLIISKENKTSEFRQAWIDALRGDLSCCIAHVHNISGIAGVKPEPDLDLWVKSQADFFGANKSVVNIRLRLNPDEEQAERILKLLDELEHLIPSGQITNIPTINQLEKKLVAAAQILLKEEWKRVKRGEVVFQLARGSSLGLFIGFGATLVWLFFRPSIF